MDRHFFFLKKHNVVNSNKGAITYSGNNIVSYCNKHTSLEKQNRNVDVLYI